MAKPKVYADFHDADPQGRLLAEYGRTVEELSRQQIVLREGLTLPLYADDLDSTGNADELLVDGIATYSAKRCCWLH